PSHLALLSLHDALPICQLLHYMGPTNIVFGSDSLWYGGPQWQIEALWRSQIPDDIADRWGYSPLTEGAKRHILGLNSARLYGLRSEEHTSELQSRVDLV